MTGWPHGRLWWWAWPWGSPRFRWTIAGAIVTAGAASSVGGGGLQVRRRPGWHVASGGLSGARRRSLWSWRVRGSQEGLSRLWDGFWRALLGVGCWWSDCETFAGGVRWLSRCRRSEPLPPALADGLDGRGRAADNSRLVAHGQANSQGWRQNKLEKSRRACFAGSPAADYPACGIASITRLLPHSHRFFSLVK